MTYSIVMVCLGNICRSPLAEGIMRDIAKKRDLPIRVDSAGTAGYHVGEPPDSRGLACAKRHGIDNSRLRGRKFSKKDFSDFDEIFVMDRSNYRDVIAKASTAEDKAKVKMILDEDPSNHKGAEVPDPWYGDDMFEPVFSMLEKACNKIADRLEKQLK